MGIFVRGYHSLSVCYQVFIQQTALENLLFIVHCSLAGEIEVRPQLLHLETPGEVETRSIWVPLVIPKRILWDM